MAPQNKPLCKSYKPPNSCLLHVFIQSSFSYLYFPVKTLIDLFSDIPDSLPLQIEVCKENIEWSVAEKRIYLRQSLETRLVALYLDNKMYSEALVLISVLLKELKRLDDKMVLVEVQLLESRVCHALRNLPKARVRRPFFFFFFPPEK